MSRISKSFWQNLLLFVVSVVLSAILIEVALRFVLPPPIVWLYPQEQYRYDDEINHWLEANQSAYTHDKVVSTNSEGIRDSDYDFKSGPGVYRILALGDSQTFGNGLELADTWPKQLELSLNQSGDGRQFEVLNCGVPGSDTWQHEIILNRMLASYKPDAVILAFYVNDVVKRFEPRPVHQGAGSEIGRRISYLLKRSALLLTLRTAWGAVNQWWLPNPGGEQQQALLRGEVSPVLSERWAQVDNSLSGMKKLSDAYNAAFTIVKLPRRDQISGEIPWEGYNRRLSEITEKHEIPAISVIAPMQQEYNNIGKDLFIPWDGHNSKIANYIITREIADKLKVVRVSK